MKLVGWPMKIDWRGKSWTSWLSWKTRRTKIFWNHTSWHPPETKIVAVPWTDRGHFRKRRLAELANISQTSIHGNVYPLQKPDYSRDVTEASQSTFVFVHLTSALGTNIESRLLTELWRELARKYGDLKFCEIRADMCIEGYPEKNCPTILVYHKGDIVRQLVTLKELRGQSTTQEGSLRGSLMTIRCSFLRPRKILCDR